MDSRLDYGEISELSMANQMSQAIPIFTLGFLAVLKIPVK